MLHDPTHVAICTPVYGEVSVPYLQSVVHLAQMDYVSFDLIVKTGSLLPRLRNELVAMMLADPRYTHLLFLDADIGFKPDDLGRLLRSGHSVCGGIYPMKRRFDPPHMPATMQQLELLTMRYAFNLKSSEFEVPEDGFVEVQDLPCGFLLVKRGMLEQMMKEYPELRYQPDQTVNSDPATAPFHYGLFDTMIDGGRYVSEDCAFCRRVQRIGGSVWGDMRSVLTHEGRHAYRGDLFGTLQALSMKGTDE